jgi:hypothetical protein
MLSPLTCGIGFDDRDRSIGWALNRLEKEGHVTHPRTGIWRITEKGLSATITPAHGRSWSAGQSGNVPTEGGALTRKCYNQHHWNNGDFQARASIMGHTDSEAIIRTQPSHGPQAGSHIVAETEAIALDYGWHGVVTVQHLHDEHAVILRIGVFRIGYLKPTISINSERYGEGVLSRWPRLSELDIPSP